MVAILERHLYVDMQNDNVMWNYESPHNFFKVDMSLDQYNIHLSVGINTGPKLITEPTNVPNLAVLGHLQTQTVLATWRLPIHSEYHNSK